VPCLQGTATSRYPCVAFVSVSNSSCWLADSAWNPGEFDIRGDFFNSRRGQLKRAVGWLLPLSGQHQPQIYELAGCWLLGSRDVCNQSRHHEGFGIVKIIGVRECRCVPAAQLTKARVLAGLGPSGVCCAGRGAAMIAGRTSPCLRYQYVQQAAWLLPKSGTAYKCIPCARPGHHALTSAVCFGLLITTGELDAVAGVQRRCLQTQIDGCRNMI
jgi:hypothetical protein